MSIDVRVFEHARYEGVLLEKPLALSEQKRCLGSRHEYWLRNNLGQDPTPYLPGPDYLRHCFQSRIDGNYLVVLPVEDSSKTASSRLPITSLKWKFLNLGDGEKHVLDGDGDRIHSRDEIGGVLIQDVPDAACLIGNAQELRVLVLQALRSIVDSYVNASFSALFCVAASEAKLRRTTAPAVASLRGLRAGAFQHQSQHGNKKPASAFAKTGSLEFVLAAFITRPQAEQIGVDYGGNLRHRRGYSSTRQCVASVRTRFPMRVDTPGPTTLGNEAVGATPMLGPLTWHSGMPCPLPRGSAIRQFATL